MNLKQHIIIKLIMFLIKIEVILVMNKVVAVVVTYNRKDILKKNIDCLLNQVGASCDVLIINNASTDGTEEMIRAEYNIPQVIYINTGANLGGAGGFEYGIGKATMLGYEYIWIMDDDTWPEKDALANFFAADQKLDGKWGFLSSAVYWTDGKLCKANKPKKSLFTFIGDKDLTKDYTKVLMGSFVSLLIRTSTVKEVGLPIGDYFIWTDDYEFCGRISRKYPCYFVPSSRVTHAMKTNVKADISSDDIARVDRYKCLYRNDVHCYRQFGFVGWIYIWMKQVFSIVKVLIKSKDHKKERILVITGGYKEGLKYSPKV